jgi:hypothetical protein
VECTAAADAACVGWGDHVEDPLFWTTADPPAAYLGAYGKRSWDGQSRAGGGLPAARKDAAAWDVGGELFLFGGSLPAAAGAGMGALSEWDEVAAEMGLSSTELGAALVHMNESRREDLLVRLG